MSSECYLKYLTLFGWRKCKEEEEEAKKCNQMSVSGFSVGKKEFRKEEVD